MGGVSEDDLSSPPTISSKQRPSTGIERRRETFQGGKMERLSILPYRRSAPVQAPAEGQINGALEKEIKNGCNMMPPRVISPHLKSFRVSFEASHLGQVKAEKGDWGRGKSRLPGHSPETLLFHGAIALKPGVAVARSLLSERKLGGGKEKGSQDGRPGAGRRVIGSIFGSTLSFAR